MINVIEVDELPVNYYEYKQYSFIKLKSDKHGIYFVKGDGNADYISMILFSYIKKHCNKSSYLDKLIALSGKYTSDDIIKFKNEGMI